jgi:DNA-binding transcriptional MerR regulator
MENQNKSTPVIPNKRYFTIGEASKISDVKAHVLRYWEQEFPELDPIKRKGNRRYYQQKDLVMILKIKGYCKIKALP